MAQGESERVREAQKVASSNPQKAEQIYKEIISQPPSVTSDAATREYETALLSLGELYRDEKSVVTPSPSLSFRAEQRSADPRLGSPRSW